MPLPTRLQKLIDTSRIWFLEQPLSPPTAEESALADDLRNAMQRLQIDLDPGLPAAQLFWNNNMAKLKEQALESDPRDFISWDVVKGTMFVKYATYSRTEYSYLRQSPDWARWQAATREDKAGHPPPCPFDAGTSCNLIHHAYHLARYERSMGDSIGSYDFAVEFGGGYGGMCRLFHKLGFAGRYVIFDLPAFSLLQEYFLKSVGITVLGKADFMAGKPGVLCVSDMSVLKELTTATYSESMLLATWSLSESPVPTRDEVLEHTGAFDAFLIALQPAFEDIDNLAYFDSWRKGKGGYQWQFEEMQHIPNQRYLFGMKK